MVYGSPEVLLSSTSYFFKTILHDPRSPFTKNLVCIALDECHVCKNYGEFRPAYNSLIRLRQSLPNIPILALSATLMKPDIEDVRRALNMRDPIIIRRSIRRKNLTLWFAAIKSPDFKDLDILIADGITKAEDIPQTLIYVDIQLEANRIARHLRRRLPPNLGPHKRDIIRAYSSPLDHSSKEFTMDQLFIGNARIAICTEALGLGVHIRAIPRVVQWKLHSTLTLNDWYQRIGRAGRDTDDECLGITFLSPANLSMLQSLTKNNKSSTSDINQSSADQRTFDYTIAVTEQTMDEIKKRLPLMYVDPVGKSGKKKRRTGKELLPPLQWLICGKGCRHGPILACYEDPNIHEVGSKRCCCICMVNTCIQEGTLGSSPSLHGIPLSITLAYEQYMTSIECVKKQRKQVKYGKLSAERLQDLMTDITNWRSNLAFQISDNSFFHVKMLLSDKAIDTIRHKIRCLGVTEDDLKAILRPCGYSFPTSSLNIYIPSLTTCINESLKRSQPPSSNLVEKVNAARGVSVLRPVPKFPNYKPSAREESKTSSSGQHNAVNSWPVPPVIPRVPLAVLPFQDLSLTSKFNIDKVKRSSESTITVLATSQDQTDDHVEFKNANTDPHHQSEEKLPKIKINLKRVRKADPAGFDAIIRRTEKRRMC